MERNDVPGSPADDDCESASSEAGSASSEAAEWNALRAAWLLLYSKILMKWRLCQDFAQKNVGDLNIATNIRMTWRRTVNMLETLKTKAWELKVSYISGEGPKGKVSKSSLDKTQTGETVRLGARRSDLWWALLILLSLCTMYALPHVFSSSLPDLGHEKDLPSTRIRKSPPRSSATHTSHGGSPAHSSKTTSRSKAQTPPHKAAAGQVSSSRVRHKSAEEVANMRDVKNAVAEMNEPRHRAEAREQMNIAVKARMLETAAQRAMVDKKKQAVQPDMVLLDINA